MLRILLLSMLALCVACGGATASSGDTSSSSSSTSRSGGGGRGGCRSSCQREHNDCTLGAQSLAHCDRQARLCLDRCQ